MEQSNTFDTIIVGGGVAGLASAARLGAAGQRVALLEARERLGGRILSHLEPELPVPMELGAEFIHGRAAAKSTLLSEAGVVPVNASSEQRFYQGGTWHPADDHITGIEKLFEGIEANGSDISFEDLLKQPRADAIGAQTKAYARMLIEGFDAADPKDASSLAIAREWQGGATVGGAQFRPLGGYPGLLRALRASLGPNVEVLTGAVVRKITWRKHGVNVRSDHFGRDLSLTARRAVLTLPVSLLASKAVAFEPDLGKEVTLNGLAMGPVVKLLLVFATPFWEQVERGQLQDIAFFHDLGGAFPTFWTSLPQRLPYLTAWAGGPKATALAGQTKDALTQQALRGLERLFGTVPRPEKVLFHDWQADPFSQGAYSYVKVGGLNARKKLAEPLEDVLFFAGEATNVEGEDGTVYGALQSGQRAANNILRVEGIS